MGPRAHAPLPARLLVVRTQPALHSRTLAPCELGIGHICLNQHHPFARARASRRLTFFLCARYPSFQMGRRILLIGCHALPLPYSLQVVLLELVFVATFGFHVHLQARRAGLCG